MQLIKKHNAGLKNAVYSFHRCVLFFSEIRPIAELTEARHSMWYHRKRLVSRWPPLPTFLTVMKSVQKRRGCVGPLCARSTVSTCADSSRPVDPFLFECFSKCDAMVQLQQTRENEWLYTLLLPAWISTHSLIENDSWSLKNLNRFHLLQNPYLI